MSGSVNSGYGTWVIRTPSMPGSDSTCATDCPAQPWAFGLSVTVGPSYGHKGYAVTVAPPWYLITGTNTPFCPKNSTMLPPNCLWFDGTTSELLYVVTNDPNAPARNVTFQYASQGMCP